MPDLFTVYDYIPNVTQEVVTGEEHTVPAMGTKEIHLRHIPRQEEPSTVAIPGFTEVTTPPAEGQFRVHYGEEGGGRVEFHVSAAGQTVAVNYHACGTVGRAVHMNALKDAVESSAATITSLDSRLSGDIATLGGRLSGAEGNIEGLQSVVIVDHNLDVTNPANGFYVRWANGLQMCWDRWQQEPLDPEPVQVDRKQSGVERTFPAAFKTGTNPACNIIMEPNYWATAEYGSTGNYGQAELTAQGSGAGAVTNTVVKFSYDLKTYRGRLWLSYKAIGVWK